MVEKILKELKNSNTKLATHVELGCENMEFDIDGGRLWIKKPYGGKILVHILKEYDTEEEAIELLKAMDRYI